MLEEEWGYREEWSSQERKASLKMNYWYHHFSGSWSSVHRECPSEVSTRERRWNIYPQASILSCELPQGAFSLVHLLLDWSVVVPLHHVNSWGGIRDGLAQNAQSLSSPQGYWLGDLGICFRAPTYVSLIRPLPLKFTCAPLCKSMLQWDFQALLRYNLCYLC